jgi:5-oxoprolinase (ATP-hydrolysing)
VFVDWLTLHLFPPAHLILGYCRYVSAFKAGFDSGLGAVQLLFMQSDGGLAPADDFSGHKAILSGPAGEHC